MQPQFALLALEDGSLFKGYFIGPVTEVMGEVVFNTAMTGYQEVLTDPSYAGQMVTFTTPHIGNTGCNDEDYESAQAWAKACIIRDVPHRTSNWRSQQTLQDFLNKHKIVGITGIDTRRLTRLLREKGCLQACITPHTDDTDAAVAKAKAAPPITGANLTTEVTCKKPISWTETTWRTDSPTQDGPHVVVYDFGVKHQILRLFADRGCKLTVVPAHTPADKVLAMAPDGIFLSNGPGDPAACSDAIEMTRLFLEKRIPLFGICLGMQILALASGAHTYKMPFGHHGANHPVSDLECNVVAITSQNHNFAVAEDSLPSLLQVTHRSLFDHSIQGIAHTQSPAFGFQGHPEASPGPHDLDPLFDRFMHTMAQHPTTQEN